MPLTSEQIAANNAANEADRAAYCHLPLSAWLELPTEAVRRDLIEIEAKRRRLAEAIAHRATPPKAPRTTKPATTAKTAKPRAKRTLAAHQAPAPTLLEQLAANRLREERADAKLCLLPLEVWLAMAPWQRRKARAAARRAAKAAARAEVLALPAVQAARRARRAAVKRASRVRCKIAENEAQRKRRWAAKKAKATQQLSPADINQRAFLADLRDGQLDVNTRRRVWDAATLERCAAH
jgi:hypothetical protein